MTTRSRLATGGSPVGQDVYETEDTLHDELGDALQVLQHRFGRREARPLRLHHQRQEPCRRPFGRRCRHGFQEAQSRRRPRYGRRRVADRPAFRTACLALPRCPAPRHRHRPDQVGTPEPLVNWSQVTPRAPHTQLPAGPSSEHAEQISGETIAEKILGALRCLRCRLPDGLWPHHPPPPPTASSPATATAPRTRPSASPAPAARRRSRGRHQGQLPLQRTRPRHHFRRRHHRLRHGAVRARCAPAERGRFRAPLWCGWGVVQEIQPANRHARRLWLRSRRGRSASPSGSDIPSCSWASRSSTFPRTTARHSRHGPLLCTSNRGACHIRGELQDLDLYGQVGWRVTRDRGMDVVDPLSMRGQAGPCRSHRRTGSA